MNHLQLARQILRNGKRFDDVDEGGSAESGPRVSGSIVYRWGAVALVFTIDSWGPDYIRPVYLISHKPIAGWYHTDAPAGAYASAPVQEWEYDFEDSTVRDYLRRQLAAQQAN